MSREELDLSPSNQARLHALDFVGHRGELAVGMRFFRAHRDDRKPGALPETVMFDLGHRHVELLEPSLDAAEHHALLFERPAAGHVQLNREKPDHHQAVTATRSIANTSMMSPTLMSLNFSKPIPHSNPLFTSL